MDINRANLEAMFKSFYTSFQAGLGFKLPVDLSFLYRDFPSMTAANFYAWLDRIPGFREWLGDRQYNDIASQRFELKNRDFECAVRVPNKDIEDDQYGVYAPIVEMEGESWTRQLHELVVEVLTANPTCFTGKAICATDHKYGKNTICNRTGSALSETTFNAALAAAAEWKFSNGELVRPQFTHLVVGPKLRATGFALVKAQTEISIVTNKAGTENVGAGEVPNPNYGAAELVLLPDLAGDYDDYWFLVDGSRPIKAISRQLRRAPKPRMSTDPEFVERTGYVDFLADGRAAAGPTFPHLIYGGIL